MKTANRVRAIDFWRGAVLIVILVDHIPGNPLEHFTPRNFSGSRTARRRLSSCPACRLA